jgi:hypothetical protein
VRDENGHFSVFEVTLGALVRLLLRQMLLLHRNESCKKFSATNWQ